MANIIIIPYFSEQEVDRYLRIADRLRTFAQQRAAYSFLLASSPKIEPSQRLYDCFSQIAPTTHFACPSQIFGYPQGPTAMFWDCMDHIAQHTPRDGGFSLWMESDMVPVKPDWIDRLADEWQSLQPSPLLMGCLVPRVMKKRFWRRPRLWIPEHINGGACYAKDFGEAMPKEAREGVFDLSVYAFAEKMGRAFGTQSIGFASVDRARLEISKPERVLLHGFMQDKDAFIQKCIDVSREEVESYQPPAPWVESLDHAYRRFKVRFVIRGHRAMLTALQQQQDADESKLRRAA